MLPALPRQGSICFENERKTGAKGVVSGLVPGELPRLWRFCFQEGSKPLALSVTRVASLRS
ncbi:hypothetical protein ACSSV1_004714 [Labrenzia sp. MBR-25]